MSQCPAIGFVHVTFGAMVTDKTSLQIGRFGVRSELHTTSSIGNRWRVPLYVGRPIHFATGRSLRDYRDCRDTDESFALLGRYAGHVSSYLATFRDKLSVPSSSSRKSKTTRTSGHVLFTNNIYLCKQLFSLPNSRDETKAPETS